MKIVLASGNMGKCKEIQNKLAAFPVELILQTQLNVESVPETGTTFVENAIIKARHACIQTGLPAIADDSGIEVFDLNGAPGIYSARYASDGDFDVNMDKVLAELSKIEGSSRRARFVSVIVFMRSQYDATPEIFYGLWDGYIHSHKLGDNGFGYDPIFYVPELNKTAAQLSIGTKNDISHRAKSLTKLVNFFEENNLLVNG